MLEFQLVLIQNSEALLRVLYRHKHLRCCNILYSMKQTLSITLEQAISSGDPESLFKCADSLLNECC